MTRVSERVGRVDWQRVATDLGEVGFARLGTLLTRQECDQLVRLWSAPRRFRKCVEMERLRFGVGEYRYFATPLPRVVAHLRQSLYKPLAQVAPSVCAREADYPPTLAAFRKRCSEAGQTEPTPLVLRYVTGGYNRLHRDLYGAVAFPLQVVVSLSRPGSDFEGGEFLLVENHPRAQSIGHAVRLEAGEGLAFPTSYRTVAGRGGPRTIGVRHGLSRVTSGTRFALGIIFHDAA